MIFPTNAIVFTTKISGNTTENIVEASFGYDVTVISVTMQQEKDLSDTELICNSSTVALNYGKDYPQMFTDYSCDSQTLYLDKTGNDEAFVQVIYTTTTPIYETINIEGISTENGFTYGDMLIGTILLFIFAIMFFGGIWSKITGVKNKRSMYNEYLYNSAEGKGNYID